MQLQLNNNKEEHVIFNPSFHKIQAQRHKAKSVSEYKQLNKLTQDEKYLICGSQSKKQSIKLNKNEKDYKDQRGKSLPIFNNQILSRQVSRMQGDHHSHRKKDSLFGKIQASCRLPAPVQHEDQCIAPRKKSVVLKPQELPYDLAKKNGAKVHFIKTDISQSIIEQDFKHQQQQQTDKSRRINTHPTKQILPLLPITLDRNSYLSKKKNLRIKNKNPIQDNKKRASVSLPSIQNRLDRQQQIKIQLVCQRKGQLRQDRDRFVFEEVNKAWDKKIVVKKVSKKRRQEMIGHKRVNTDPYQVSPSIMLISAKKKMTLKYEEELKFHYGQLSKLYTDKLDSYQGYRQQS